MPNPEFLSLELITQPIEISYLNHDFSRVPVLSTWEYRPYDPYVLRVELRVHQYAKPTVWEFARELPKIGLTKPSGYADVRFTPYVWHIGNPGRAIHMQFTVRNEATNFLVPRPPLVRFLRETYQRVPDGQESYIMAPIVDTELTLFYAEKKWPLEE